MRHFGLVNLVPHFGAVSKTVKGLDKKLTGGAGKTLVDTIFNSKLGQTLIGRRQS